ncbi:MAG: hypothetical protein KDK59_10205, partial [Simkania sp.]|nr:hypothetical protein [Simkania sp.]
MSYKSTDLGVTHGHNENFVTIRMLMRIFLDKLLKRVWFCTVVFRNVLCFYSLTTTIFITSNIYAEENTTVVKFLPPGVVEQLEANREPVITIYLDEFGKVKGSARVKQYKGEDIFERLYPTDDVVRTLKDPEVVLNNILSKYKKDKQRILAPTGNADLAKFIYGQVVGQIPKAGPVLNFFVDQALNAYFTQLTTDLETFAQNHFLVSGLSQAMSELGLDTISNSADAEQIFVRAHVLARMTFNVSHLKQRYGLSDSDVAMIEDLWRKQSFDLQKAHLLITREQGKEIQKLHERIDVQNNRLRLLTKDVEGIDKEVEANTKELAKFQKAFSSYRDLTEERFQVLDSVVTGIEKDLNELDGLVSKNIFDISQNKNDIFFLQKYLFEGLDPSKQLQALEDGFFKNMDDTKRENLYAKIQFAKKKQEFTSAMIGVANGAGDLYDIMTTIGIDAPWMESFGLTAQAANHVASAVVSFMSGPKGYLGALKSVSKIFGLGRPSIGAVRHQQVMDALGKLGEGQQHIMEMMATLGEGQQKIIANQIIILDSIQQLTHKLEERFHELSEALRILQGEVLINRQINVELLLQEVSKCTPALNGINDERSGYVDGRFKSYELLKLNYVGNREWISQCLHGLSDIFPIPRLKDEAFKLETHKTAEDIGQIDAYIDMYKKSRDFFFSRFNKSEQANWSVRHGLASLMIPVSTTAELEEKGKTINQLSAPLPRRFAENEIPLNSIIQDPYSVEIVSTLVSWLLEFYHYFELVEGGKIGADLISKEVLATSNTPNILARHTLEYALIRLDMALAQQNMLAGDFLLEDMQKIFQKGDKDKEEYQSVIRLLQGNSQLAQNFLIYSLRKEILGKGYNFIHYQFALDNGGDDWLLRQITQSDWTFKFQQEGSSLSPSINWSAEFDVMRDPPMAESRDTTFRVRLPAVMDLFRGRLNRPPEVDELLKLRSQVTDELLSFGFMQNLSSSKYRVF